MNYKVVQYNFLCFGFVFYFHSFTHPFIQQISARTTLGLNAGVVVGVKENTKLHDTGFLRARRGSAHTHTIWCRQEGEYLALWFVKHEAQFHFLLFYSSGEETALWRVEEGLTEDRRGFDLVVQWTDMPWPGERTQEGVCLPIHFSEGLSVLSWRETGGEDQMEECGRWYFPKMATPLIKRRSLIPSSWMQTGFCDCLNQPSMANPMLPANDVMNVHFCPLDLNTLARAPSYHALRVLCCEED